jgi:hypothetical protein
MHLVHGVTACLVDFCNARLFDREGFLGDVAASAEGFFPGKLPFALDLLDEFMSVLSKLLHLRIRKLFVNRHLQRSAMTRVAGDALLSAEVLPVDLHLQQDHPPGLLFCFFRVLIVNGSNVTIFAGYTERCIERHHDRIHVRRRNALEHLDIFVNLL